MWHSKGGNPSTPDDIDHLDPFDHHAGVDDSEP